jgi:hypothetical protein
LNLERDLLVSTSLCFQIQRVVPPLRQGDNQDPEISLDDMEAEEAAFLDCKGGTSGGWASNTLKKISKHKTVKKITSWWTGQVYEDDYSAPAVDPDEVMVRPGGGVTRMG